MPPTFSIEHYDQLSGAPRDLFRLVILVHAQMLADGQADAPGVGRGSKVLVAVSATECVAGFITYSTADWQKAIYIRLGFVYPAYRRNGVYRRLWDALVLRSREAGYREIYGITKVDNTVMRAVARSLGREEESINLKLSL